MRTFYEGFGAVGGVVAWAIAILIILVLAGMIEVDVSFIEMALAYIP